MPAEVRVTIRRAADFSRFHVGLLNCPSTAKNLGPREAMTDEKLQLRSMDRQHLTEALMDLWLMGVLQDAEQGKREASSITGPEPPEFG
jgi:hypothetical protein